MRLSRGAKPILIVLAGLYVLVILGIVIQAVTAPEPKNKGKLVRGLMETAAANGAKLTRPEAEAMYDAHLAPKGAIIAFNYTLFLQMLNFAVLLVALYGLLWQPVLKFLDERREGIRSDLEAARRNREESGQERGEATQMLSDTRRERMRLLETAEREAEDARLEILKGARGEAERLTENARQEIAGEVERARTTLQAEVADLSVSIASQILEREVNKDDQKTLFEQLLGEVEAGKAE